MDHFNIKLLIFVDILQVFKISLSEVQGFGNFELSPMCNQVYIWCMYIWALTWDFQQCGMCDQQRLRSACAYAQPDQSLCYSLEYSISVKLPTELNLEFLSLKGGCAGSSEYTLVKISHCWKFCVTAHILTWYFRWCIPHNVQAARCLWCIPVQGRL